MTKDNYTVDIRVITMLDGLTHDYFSYINWNFDNSYPVGNASLVTFFAKESFQYWNTYRGPVIISAKIKNNKINTNSKKYYNDIIKSHYKKKAKNEELINKMKKQHHTQEKISKLPRNKIINNEYNYSFIGVVKSVKQKGKEITIKLQDIGWKFSQHVPKNFRDKYIANQKLDDAFQAICEFMNIDFAYSIEDLNKYNFGSDGYSVQKNGQTIEQVPTINEEFEIETKNNNETNTTETNTETETDKSKTDTQSKTNTQSQQDSSIASGAVNTSLQNANLNTNCQTNESNGDSCKDKIDKYREEFEEKFKNLFIGNTYYESDIASNVLNYNYITIQPTTTSPQSSSMSEVNSENINNEENDSQTDTSQTDTST